MPTIHSALSVPVFVTRANYRPEASSWVGIPLHAVIKAKLQSAQTKDSVIHVRK